MLHGSLMVRLSSLRSNFKIMKYTCPCCGYKTFDEKPGSYAVCPICYWEDDPTQLANLTSLGANVATLIEAQKDFEKFGTSNYEQFSVLRENPTNGYEKDRSWRRIDLKIDNIKQEHKKYYWLT